MSASADWIDLLEGELDSAAEAELEVLLRQSIIDRKQFLLLSRLRDRIAETDCWTVAKTKVESLEYQKQLTDKIMGAIRKKARPVKPVRGTPRS
jgi:hypothetical protein